jgi:hypothetical protein
MASQDRAQILSKSGFKPVNCSTFSYAFSLRGILCPRTGTMLLFGWNPSMQGASWGNPSLLGLSLNFLLPKFWRAIKLAIPWKFVFICLESPENPEFCEIKSILLSFGTGLATEGTCHFGLITLGGSTFSVAEFLSNWKLVSYMRETFSGVFDTSPRSLPDWIYAIYWFSSSYLVFMMFWKNF